MIAVCGPRVHRAGLWPEVARPPSPHRDEPARRRPGSGSTIARGQSISRMAW